MLFLLGFDIKIILASQTELVRVSCFFNYLGKLYTIGMMELLIKSYEQGAFLGKI